MNMSKLTLPKRITEKYISAHWGSFLELMTQELDQALQIYLKNQNDERDKYGKRRLIAPAENFPASLSVASAGIALESFANAQAFYKKLKTYNTWDELANKVQVLDISSANKITAVRELTVCRDTVIHGHLWLKRRTSDQDTYNLREIRSYLWAPFKTKLSNKFTRNVNWKARSTNIFGFNIIPLDLSYLDGVKALKILITITEELFELAGMKWRPPMYPHPQDGYSKQTIEALSQQYYPEDWLKYFENQLNVKDRAIYDSCFKNF